jgi:hypothetical protein
VVVALSATSQASEKVLVWVVGVGHLQIAMSEHDADDALHGLNMRRERAAVNARRTVVEDATGFDSSCAGLGTLITESIGVGSGDFRDGPAVPQPVRPLPDPQQRSRRPAQVAVDQHLLDEDSARPDHDHPRGGYICP